MGLVMPDFGLFFWMILSFSILLFILKRFAWKPITKALSERDNLINSALNAAEKAKREMIQLQTRNEDLLKEAMLEREKIIKEAREMKESIVREAKSQAAAEATKMMEAAKLAIEHEKTGAILEMKRMVATFSIDIAEKVLQNQLADPSKQKELINRYIEKININ
jgi:F-type H+-transporting ATPase subunit b